MFDLVCPGVETSDGRSLGCKKPLPPPLTSRGPAPVRRRLYCVRGWTPDIARKFPLQQSIYELDATVIGDSAGPNLT